MKTSHSVSAVGRQSGLDRLADVILDRNGSSYGDERERTRWLEAIAVIWTIQTVLTAGAFAIAAWFGPVGAKPYLWGIYGATTFPSLIGIALLQRNNVEIHAAAQSTFGKGVQAVMGLLLIVGIVGLAFVRTDSGSSTGMGIAVGVGIAVAALLTMRLVAKRRRAPDDEA
jgi:hypothetical protein